MRDNDDNRDNRHNHDNGTMTSRFRIWRVTDAHAAAEIKAHNHPVQRCFPCPVRELSL
jgi:hypothetical protein